MADPALPLLFVLGDSISLQYGPYLEQYLARRFRYQRKEVDGDASANLDVPQGSNGGDSKMVLAYLAALRDHGQLRADLMLLNCGLHDIKVAPATGQRQVPIEQYRQNLEAITALVAEAGIPLAWVRTTPAVDRVHNKPGTAFHRHAADNDAYNDVSDAVMGERGIPSIDLHGFTRSLGGDEIFCDHVHFTEPIRQLHAAFIAGWVTGHAAADGDKPPSSSS